MSQLKNGSIVRSMARNWYRGDEGGWTLVEMVLTLALIGLLALLSIPAFAQLGERVERQLFLDRFVAEVRLAQREAIGHEEEVAVEVDKTGRAFRVVRGGKVIRQEMIPHRYRLRSNYPENRLLFRRTGQVRGGRFQLYEGKKRVGEVIIQVASGRTRLEVEW